jgi:ABC-type multidrug transport system permease subunit
MTPGRLVLQGLTGVVRRDAALFWSYRIRAVSQTLALFFSLSLFYYVSRLVNVSEFPSADAYFAYVAVGIVILHVLTASVGSVPVAVRQELVAGTFERFVVSPLGACAGIAGMLAFPLLSALAMSTLQLALAALVFGMDIHWATAPLAIPVALLGALSFAPFALFMASAVMVVKQISGGVTFVTTGMAFVGGFFFPTSLLPGWLRWMSDVQPFTPTLELLRHVLVRTPMTGSTAGDLARMIGFAVVLFPLAYVTLDCAIGISRRRGTLIEY